MSAILRPAVGLFAFCDAKVQFFFDICKNYSGKVHMQEVKICIFAKKALILHAYLRNHDYHIPHREHQW